MASDDLIQKYKNRFVWGVDDLKDLPASSGMSRSFKDSEEDMYVLQHLLVDLLEAVNALRADIMSTPSPRP